MIGDANVTINERLFQLLTNQRRLQTELAKFIGLSQQNIATWKQRGSDPPAKYIFNIAEFFNVSVEWLLTGEEQPHNSFVNNGSVAGNLGPHTGTIIIRNGGEHILSEECAELVRIYESLDVRQRIRLLKSAFEIADDSAESKNQE